MKVMHKKSLAVILTFAMFFVCLFTGVGILKANAAEDVFDYTNIANRIKLGGISEQDVADAFEAEGSRLKAEMEAAGYSLNILASNQPLGNGWQARAGMSYFLSAHLSLGDFDRGSAAWSNDYAFIVYNPNMNAAFTTRGYSCTLYVNADGAWGYGVPVYGLPTGNQFTVGETTYQNFGRGYRSNNTFVFGKKVDAEGVESDLTAQDVANGMLVPIFDDDTGINVKELNAAYLAYYADKEVNLNQFDQVGSTSTAWRQSTADGGNLVYNTAKKEIFTVSGTFLTGFNTNTAQWGMPIGEETVIHEVTYQLYENGVAYVEEGAVKFAEASHVDPATGEIVPNFNSGSVGLISEAAAAKLPAGVTAEAVKAAVDAVYVEDMGTPNAEMEFFAYSMNRGFDFTSEDILVQTFVAQDADGNTVTTKVFVDVKATTLTAVVMDNDTYALYKLPTRFNEGNKVYDVTGEMVLGPAISNVFEVSGTKYQNFLFGAMNLTSTDAATQVLPGVNYAADGTRTVLDLSDFIRVDESNLRIPKSYNISAEDLLAKFKAVYKAYVAQGIALGMPNVEGIGSWIPDVAAGGGYNSDNEFNDGRGMIKLGLYMTDSDAICYYGVTAMLAYSPKDGNVYIMSDSVISNLANYYCVYGAPTSNLTETKLTTSSGVEVTVYIQNFELGYLTVMGSSASMTADKNWDFDLRGPVNLDGSKIPGTTYPGESSTEPSENPGENSGENPDENPGTNPDGDTEEPTEKKGCKSVISVAGGVGALVVLVAAVTIVFVKKRREE